MFSTIEDNPNEPEAGEDNEDGPRETTTASSSKRSQGPDVSFPPAKNQRLRLYFVICDSFDIRFYIIFVFDSCDPILCMCGCNQLITTKSKMCNGKFWGVKQDDGNRSTTFCSSMLDYDHNNHCIYCKVLNNVDIPRLTVEPTGTWSRAPQQKVCDVPLTQTLIMIVLLP